MHTGDKTDSGIVFIYSCTYTHTVGERKKEGEKQRQNMNLEYTQNNQY